MARGIPFSPRQICREGSRSPKTSREARKKGGGSWFFASFAEEIGCFFFGSRIGKSLLKKNVLNSQKKIYIHNSAL